MTALRSFLSAPFAGEAFPEDNSLGHVGETLLVLHACNGRLHGDMSAMSSR